MQLSTFLSLYKSKSRQPQICFSSSFHLVALIRGSSLLQNLPLKCFMSRLYQHFSQAIFCSFQFSNPNQIFFVSLCLHLHSFPFFATVVFFLCSPLTPVGLVDRMYFIYITLSPIIYMYPIYFVLSFPFFFAPVGFSLQSIDSCGLHIFYIQPIIPYITSFICIPYILFFLFFFLLQWVFLCSPLAISPLGKWLLSA